MERWGCSRIQIGSIILQLLGFGIPRANALLKGLASSAPISTADATDIAQDVRMAALWRHATKHTGKAPEVALPAKYYPNGNDYRHVINRLTQIRNEPPSPSWIKALKEDLPTPLEGDTTDSFAQQVEQE
jgi:hypothetical protein